SGLPVPARQPSDSVTSQAGPFSSLRALEPGGDVGAASMPTSPMAHNVDPMKVLVDPPDTERLLKTKSALDSKSSDPTSGTTSNPIAAPALADTSTPQDVSTAPLPNPLVEGQLEKSQPPPLAWPDTDYTKATLRRNNTNGHHFPRSRGPFMNNGLVQPYSRMPHQDMTSAATCSLTGATETGRSLWFPGPETAQQRAAWVSLNARRQGRPCVT
ncbi:hypothetical protein WJX84_003309, partial [Apatococcus fuscideae]